MKTKKVVKELQGEKDVKENNKKVNNCLNYRHLKLTKIALNLISFLLSEDLLYKIEYLEETKEVRRMKINTIVEELQRKKNVEEINEK